MTAEPDRRPFRLPALLAAGLVAMALAASAAAQDGERPPELEGAEIALYDRWYDPVCVGSVALFQEHEPIRPGDVKRVYEDALRSAAPNLPEIEFAPGCQPDMLLFFTDHPEFLLRHPDWRPFFERVWESASGGRSAEDFVASWTATVESGQLVDQRRSIGLGPGDRPTRAETVFYVSIDNPYAIEGVRPEAKIAIALASAFLHMEFATAPAGDSLYATDGAKRDAAATAIARTGRLSATDAALFDWLYAGGR